MRAAAMTRLDANQLFDHLIGASEHGWRHKDTACAGRPNCFDRKMATAINNCRDSTRPGD